VARFWTWGDGRPGGGGVAPADAGGGGGIGSLVRVPHQRRRNVGRPPFPARQLPQRRSGRTGTARATGIAGGGLLGAAGTVAPGARRHAARGRRLSAPRRLPCRRY